MVTNTIFVCTFYMFKDNGSFVIRYAWDPVFSIFGFSRVVFERFTVLFIILYVFLSYEM